MKTRQLRGRAPSGSDWLAVGFTGFLALAGIGLVGLIVWAIVAEATEPLSGTVTVIEYQPEHQVTTWMTTCTGTGTTRVCTSTPVMSWVPECFYVEYVDANGDSGNDCTDAVTFGGLEPGDHYAQDGAG